MKTLHMDQTVYEVTKKYPELIGIIASWGFPQIRNSYLRRVIGSKFTIREAIAELRLNKAKIIQSLKAHGFNIVE